MSGRNLVNEMRSSGMPVSDSGGLGIVDLVLVAMVVVAIGAAGFYGVITFMHTMPPRSAMPVDLSKPGGA